MCQTREIMRSRQSSVRQSPSKLWQTKDILQQSPCARTKVRREYRNMIDDALSTGHRLAEQTFSYIMPMAGLTGTRIQKNPSLHYT